MKKKNIAILVAVIVVAVIVVLAVMFSIKTYDVTFDTDGGSLVATQKVKVFKKATKPADPTKDGYTFDNWYYNDGIFDFDTRITKDMIIEARWLGDGTPSDGKFTVSFNSNGGSSIASVKTHDDGTIDKPANPTREGYTFVAWQYNGVDFDFSTKVTSNMTLVAKWEEGSSTSTESVPAEKVTLSPTNLSLKVGNTRRISVTLSPKEATNRSMSWSTSNNKVATVDKNGTVRAVGEGKATITVEVDGIKATVTVTVTKATTPTNPTNPTNPTEPTTPEVPVTYSVVMEDIPESAIGQAMMYVRSSKGENVAGYITMTIKGGTPQEVLIPASGKMVIKSAVESYSFSRLN